MIKKIAPCKDCADRYPGCHDRCSGYQSWKAENDLALEEQAAQNEIIGALRQTTANRCKKAGERSLTNRFRKKRKG